jgi:hypothetical protein
MMTQVRSGGFNTQAQGYLDEAGVAAGAGKTGRVRPQQRLIRTRPKKQDKTARIVRRLAVLLIGAGAACGLSAPAFASTPRPPKLSVTEATFSIPTGSASTWTLRLWSHGSLEASDAGTSGILTVTVPATSDCVFQADVSVTAPGGNPYYYSGSRATMPGCGPLPTLAGDIYLCSATGATTTQVIGGTLTAAGPQTLAVQPNPMASTPVLSGDYTMTAAAPAGYLFVVCGGSAVVASNGSSATEAVPVSIGDTGSESGGPGVGVFYVTSTALPVRADGGISAPPVSAATNAQTSPTPSLATTAVSLASRSAPVSLTAVGSSGLALTGMNTKPLLFLGLVALILGGLCTVASRVRRNRTVTCRPSSAAGL